MSDAPVICYIYVSNSWEFYYSVLQRFQRGWTRKRPDWQIVTVENKVDFYLVDCVLYFLKKNKNGTVSWIKVQLYLVEQDSVLLTVSSGTDTIQRRDF